MYRVRLGIRRHHRTARLRSVKHANKRKGGVHTDLLVSALPKMGKYPFLEMGAHTVAIAKRPTVVPTVVRAIARQKLGTPFSEKRLS